MDGGLTELFLGVTAGAYLPLAVIAGIARLVRTGCGLRERRLHRIGAGATRAD